MTFFAGHRDVLAIQLEGRKVMVKSGGLPATGGMAGAAVLPKSTVVVIVFLVTGKTGAGCTLEHVVNVTVCAFYFGVFAFQLES